MAGVTYTFKDMNTIVITLSADAMVNKKGFKALINGGKVTAVTGNAVYANTDNNIGVFGPQPSGVLEGNGAWLEYGRPGPYPKDDLTREDGDWFGNYSDLIKHTYNTKGKYTYIWDPNFMGGRLAGNDHLWWYYTEPGHTRTDNGNGNNNQVNSGLNSGSNGNGGSSAGGSSAGSSTGDTTTGMSASTATLIMIVFAVLAIVARRVRKQVC